MNVEIKIQYRGPDDYDVVYPEEVVDAMEAADLLTFTGITMRDRLICRGWIECDTLQ